MVVREQVPALMCDQTACDDLKKRVAVLCALIGVQTDQWFGADYDVLRAVRTFPDGTQQQVFCRLNEDGEPVLAYDPKSLR